MAGRADSPLGAEGRIQGFIGALGSKHQTLLRSVRRELRKRFPSANELVYDYPSSLVIAYSPTERGSDAVVAVSAGADGLRLVFNNGPALPDPKKLLGGSGKQTRFIRIESSGTLKRPEVRALLEAAQDRAAIPLRPDGRGRSIIKPKSARHPPKPKPRP